VDHKITGRRITEEQLEALRLFAGYAGLALENARLSEEIQNELSRQIQAKEKEEHRRLILEKVITTGQHVTEVHDVRTTLTHIWHGVHDDLGFDRVGLYLYNPERNSMDGTFGTNNQGEMLDEWHTSVSLDGEAEGGRSFLRVLEKPDTILLTHNYESDNKVPEGHIMAGVQDFAAIAAWAGTKPVAAICVDHNITGRRITEEQLEALRLFAGYAGLALENARLFDETQRLLKETEQRAAELAIINSVQEGLASKLDMQAIFDLVGDKIRDMFNAKTVVISSFDHEKQVSRLEYAFEDGQRIYDDELLPLFTPLNKYLIDTRQPIVINENSIEEAERYGLKIVEGTQEPKSMIFVPFGTGTRVNGAFSLQNMEWEYAFAESDVRLLQTLAGSMGIALENARLFAETQRLLKETEQRNAELAIINSVQDGLVAQMDMQGIYDLVGDKIRDIFDAQVLLIAIFDSAQGISHVPYVVEKGQRLEIKSGPMTALERYMTHTRQLLLCNEHWPERAQELLGEFNVPIGEPPKSVLVMPLIVGDQVKGIISLQNVDRENAFSDSDVRLLTTLANSMSVALENARLFDETNRRARESAALNEVGRDISSTLNLSSLMERIASHARVLLGADTSAIFLPEAGGSSYRAIVVQGLSSEEIKADTIKAGEGIIGALAQQGKAEFINDTNKDPRGVQIPGTPDQSEERLMVAPLLAGDKVSGMMAVWRAGGEPFAQADLEFLEGLSLQAAIAIKNANLFDETEQRAAELAIINSVQQGLASRLEMQAIYDLIGEKIRVVFDAQVVTVNSFNTEKQLTMLRYGIEKGKRFYNA
jgi:GAF domain-containing protein